MSSPFPGMDPWLESPYIWGDFHQAFAGVIRGQLNRRLTKPYYARLESRPEVGIVEGEDGDRRRSGPDVAVVRHPNGATAGIGVATPTRPISAGSLEIVVASEPVHHVYIEVRDPTKGHELVTLIEIVSPSNKRRGKDRRSYVRKQMEVLSSTANLIEIDFLRAGKRLFASPSIESALVQGSNRCDYIILVNRAWTREDERMAFQAFPVSMLEPLPCIPVPLRQGISEVPLDLQEAFSQTYEEGPYLQGAIDYDEPPDPPLPAELLDWAQESLRKARLVA